MGDSSWVREYDESLGTYVIRFWEPPYDAFAEYFDEDNQAWYYYNIQSGETSWTIQGLSFGDLQPQQVTNASEVAVADVHYGQLEPSEQLSEMVEDDHYGQLTSTEQLSEMDPTEEPQLVERDEDGEDVELEEDRTDREAKDGDFLDEDYRSEDRRSNDSGKEEELEDGWERDAENGDNASGGSSLSLRFRAEKDVEGTVEAVDTTRDETFDTKEVGFDGGEDESKRLSESLTCGGEWKEYYDENGYPYLYNTFTGESKWKEEAKLDVIPTPESEVSAAQPETLDLPDPTSAAALNLVEEERHLLDLSPHSSKPDLDRQTAEDKSPETTKTPTESTMPKGDSVKKLPTLLNARSKRRRTKKRRRGGKIQRKEATVQIVSPEITKHDNALLATQEITTKPVPPYATGQVVNGRCYQRLHHKRRVRATPIEAGESKVVDNGEEKKFSSLEERLQFLFNELLCILNENSQRVPRYKLLKLLVHSPWRLLGIRQHCQWMDTLCKPRTFLKTFQACGDEDSFGLDEFVQAGMKPKHIVPLVLETLRTTIPVGICNLLDKQAYVNLERFPYCRMERRNAFDEEMDRLSQETKKFASLHLRRQQDKTRQEMGRRAKWQIERKRKEAKELRHRKKWLVRVVSNKQRNVRVAAEEELRNVLAKLSIAVSESRKAFATTSPMNAYSSVGVEAAILRAPKDTQESFTGWLKSKVAAVEAEVDKKLTKRRDAFRAREDRLDHEEKARRAAFDGQMLQDTEAFQVQLKERKLKIVQMRGDDKKIRQLEDDVFGELFKHRAAFLRVVKEHALRPSLRRLRWIRTNIDANGKHHLVMDIASQARLNLSVLPCKDVQQAQYLMTRCEKFHDIFTCGSVLQVQDWFYHVNDSFVEAFVLYEYIQSPTLQNWIASPEDVDEKMALDLSQNLAQVIREMHAVGLVHCGIAPCSVRVIRGTQLKVELPILFKYRDVRTVANEAFMSPELRREGARAIAKPVDIWSFGATVYSLLTKETLVAKATTVAASTYARHRKVISRQKWARTLLKMTLKPAPHERATIDEVLSLFYREGDDTRMRLEQALLGQ